ncbi:hypothetical protein GQ54DRAFT_163553 [Martensiomyces pterosporus]|nr:hypothetical protein GQ54DRAFT_163553 [Martensiomyces pterosporus]
MERTVISFYSTGSAPFCKPRHTHVLASLRRGQGGGQLLPQHSVPSSQPRQNNNSMEQEAAAERLHSSHPPIHSRIPILSSPHPPAVGSEMGRIGNLGANAHTHALRLLGGRRTPPCPLLACECALPFSPAPLVLRWPPAPAIGCAEGHQANKGALVPSLSSLTSDGSVLSKAHNCALVLLIRWHLAFPFFLPTLLERTRHFALCASPLGFLAPNAVRVHSAQLRPDDHRASSLSASFPAASCSLELGTPCFSPLANKQNAWRASAGERGEGQEALNRRPYPLPYCDGSPELCCVRGASFCRGLRDKHCG